MSEASHNTQDQLKPDPWKRIAEDSSNGTALLQFVIKTNNAEESARIATRIAQFINNHDRSDPVYNTQLTIRSWRLEVQLAATYGRLSESQRKVMNQIESLATN